MTPPEEKAKNYVMEKLQKILQRNLKLSKDASRFDIVSEEDGIVAIVHDQIGLKKRQLNNQQEMSLVKKWLDLKREKNAIAKFLIFTEPQMLSAFKRLRNNTEEIQDESVKLILINFPVYDNSKGQICKNCSDETLTNAGIHSLLRFGFLNFEKLDQVIQKQFSTYLKRKGLQIPEKRPKKQGKNTSKPRAKTN